MKTFKYVFILTICSITFSLYAFSAEETLQSVSYDTTETTKIPDSADNKSFSEWVDTFYNTKIEAEKKFYFDLIVNSIRDEEGTVDFLISLTQKNYPGFSFLALQLLAGINFGYGYSYRSIFTRKTYQKIKEFHINLLNTFMTSKDFSDCYYTTACIVVNGTNVAFEHFLFGIDSLLLLLSNKSEDDIQEISFFYSTLEEFKQTSAFKTVLEFSSNKQVFTQFYSKIQYELYTLLATRPE